MPDDLVERLRRQASSTGGAKSSGRVSRSEGSSIAKAYELVLSQSRKSA